MEADRCRQVLHRGRPRGVGEPEPLPADASRPLQEGGGAAVLPPSLLVGSRQQPLLGSVERQRRVLALVRRGPVRLPAERAKGHHARLLQQLLARGGRLRHRA